MTETERWLIRARHLVRSYTHEMLKLYVHYEAGRSNEPEAGSRDDQMMRGDRMGPLPSLMLL
jgi:hypothetical protein